MLGAMGMTPRAIRHCFVIFGAIVGTAGIAVGGIGGWAVSWALSYYKIIPLPDRVYVLDYLPFLVRLESDFPIILLSTLTLTLTAAYSASKRASALRPVAALRR